MVTGISKKEYPVLVELEIGNSGSGNSELKAVITLTSCELLDLGIGKKINTVFKAANARIIRYRN